MFFLALEKLLSDLDYSLVSDEWYLSNFIENNISQMSSETVFQTISEFSDFMIENHRHSHDMIDIFYALYMKANTSQDFCDDCKKILISNIYDDYSQQVLRGVFLYCFQPNE